MNHGPSPYSWLLAKLCTEVAHEYFQRSGKGLETRESLT
jgi:hypothetical protein